MVGEITEFSDAFAMMSWLVVKLFCERSLVEPF